MLQLQLFFWIAVSCLTNIDAFSPRSGKTTTQRLVTTTTSSSLSFPRRIFGSPTRSTTTSLNGIDTSFMWNKGMDFGKGQFKFYKSFDEWMKPFPDEDRQTFPEVFNFPVGVYEIELQKPLGIVFEEMESGQGLYVKDLVENGNAQKLGRIEKDDRLVGITATKAMGVKYERRMIPARKFNFDTMVGAIESNIPRFGCNTVIMILERPSEADTAVTDEFMSLFVPPIGNLWTPGQ